jgi:alpha-beta hydrolase superfamily lysophospholipase
MSMLPETTYESISYWEQYQRFYPHDLRLHEFNLPNEERWQWRAFSVHLDRYLCHDASAKLIVVHGAGGYGRMFSAAGLAGQQAGAEVVAVDLPGYGLTRAPGGYTHDDWVDCITDLIFAERLRDDLPIILMGGSMGGLIAYAAAAKSRAVSALVVTCVLDPRRPQVRAAVSRFRWMARMAPSTVNRLASVIGGLKLPVAWFTKMGEMSTQAELNELVMHDPLGGANRVPLKFLASWLSYKLPVEPEDFTGCPVLVTHPEKDTWTPPALTQDFYNRLNVPRRWIMLRNAGHLPVEVPGIIELREQVTELILECGINAARAKARARKIVDAND